jgi:hypothetical protein
MMQKFSGCYAGSEEDQEQRGDAFLKAVHFWRPFGSAGKKGLKARM